MKSARIFHVFSSVAMLGLVLSSGAAGATNTQGVNVLDVRVAAGLDDAEEDAGPLAFSLQRNRLGSPRNSL